MIISVKGGVGSAELYFPICHKFSSFTSVKVIVQRVTCFTDSAATTEGSSMREISDTNQTQVC